MKNWNTRVKNCRSVGTEVGRMRLTSIFNDSIASIQKNIYSSFSPHTAAWAQAQSQEKSFFLCNVNISFVSLPPGARKLDE